MAKWGAVVDGAAHGVVAEVVPIKRERADGAA